MLIKRWESCLLKNNYRGLIFRTESTLKFHIVYNMVVISLCNKDHVSMSVVEKKLKQW